MEHVVQFGVSVDDERIEKAVMEAAAKQIDDAFKDRGYYGRKDIDAKRIIEDCVYKKLDELRDEIIDMASDKLVDRMARTKAVREAIAKVVQKVADK